MAKETTTFYRWPAGALVQEIEIRQQDNGHSVAYIEADNREELAQLRQNLRSVIRMRGWGTLSDHRNGKFVLRVTGLDSGDDLLNVLRSEEAIQGSPVITQAAPKPVKSENLTEFVQNHSLRISGVIATVGNAMSIASGIHRGKGFGQIGQGAAFAIADLPLAIAGERDDSRQLADLLRHLKQHYAKEGIEIPQNASIMVETSNRGKSFGELAMDYMHRYANQIKCSLEVIAAGFTIRAGFEQKSAPKKYVPLIWGSGFLASLLIPERKIDGEKYAAAGPLGRFWMKLQSNPLTIGGLLGYSNNIASYTSAYHEAKASNAPGGDGRKFYRWDVAIPTIMLGANGTYAISKKTVGGNIQQGELVSDVYSIAAQILNKQPDELREAAMESTAKFLGERTEIRDNHAQILVRLREEMEIQRRNPWFEKKGLPDYVPQPKKSHREDVQRDAVPNITANENIAPATQVLTHTARLAEQDRAVVGQAL